MLVRVGQHESVCLLPEYVRSVLDIHRVTTTMSWVSGAAERATV
jgi:hypothetical protein